MVDLFDAGRPVRLDIVNSEITVGGKSGGRGEVKVLALEFQGAGLGKGVSNFNGKNRGAHRFCETMVEANWMKQAAGIEKLILVEEEIVTPKDEEAFGKISSTRGGDGTQLQKGGECGGKQSCGPKRKWKRTCRNRDFECDSHCFF